MDMVIMGHNAGLSCRPLNVNKTPQYRGQLEVIVMSDGKSVLEEFGDLLEAEANEKVKKAMQLFICVDDVYKSIVLHATGFTGELTAKNLRDHFDTLDLMDGLDSCIFDMEDDLENS